MSQSANIFENSAQSLSAAADRLVELRRIFNESAWASGADKVTARAILNAVTDDLRGLASTFGYVSAMQGPAGRDTPQHPAA